MIIFIYGIVQGVGFRPTVYKVAKELGIVGYVRNNGSNVEIGIKGDPEKFVAKLKEHLPPLARIDNIETKDAPFNLKEGEASRLGSEPFIIVPSQEGTRSSAIPADTAICDDCLKELKTPGDYRYNYAFINCTNCGARFSVIKDLPYDRPKTSMEPFEMCEVCEKEYNNPSNRRHHAQTISCAKDGPKFTLFGKDGLPYETNDQQNPLRVFAEHINEGEIGVMKGWGGMHIVCKLDRVDRLREWYDRPNKPFAIMVKDLVVAAQYAKLDEAAKDCLLSHQRPIVLCKKKKEEDINPELYKRLEAVSPGLGNVGLYLPYSGIQHLLFNHLKEKAIIMTSANPKGEPLVIDNDEAITLDLDRYLLHNREIVNRIDDSLVIPYGPVRYIIRKSRGFIPDPLPIDHDLQVGSFGAERNVTASFTKKKHLYTSQYIGNITYTKTLQFLEETNNYFLKLLGIKELDAVGIDLHPQYPSRNLIKDLAKDHGAKLFPLQHHWAHGVSLMFDAGWDEQLMTLSWDGAGYGEDGTVWGGEVLLCEKDKFKRIGSLENIPLIGGDKATLEPNRLLFGIYSSLDMPEAVEGLFPEKESEIFSKTLPRSPQTSSFGRVLDALASKLDICTWRTYDGEPAMRLEPYLSGKREFEFEAAIESVSGGEFSGREVVRTRCLFEQLHNEMQGKEITDSLKANLATSIVGTIVDGMVDLAAQKCHEMGVKGIGLTGGITYNLPINDMVRTRMEKYPELELVLHHRIPNGDGGISVGQNVIAANLLK